jgi:hypothetical protein
MAYTNRTVRLAFDGTDDTLPDLGTDIWVVIRNPLLMPASMLQGSADLQLDANGAPVDRMAAINASLEIASRLVVEWNVYDPADVSETPMPLGLPATAEMMRLLPMSITNAISEIVGKALDRTN